MSTRGHGHSFTFDPGLLYFEDSKHLIKTTRPIVTKVHIESPRVEGTKFYPNRPCHMIDMHIQSTLVISKSKGPLKTVRDIRTSTYQICSIEEKQFEQPIFTNDYVI